MEGAHLHLLTLHQLRQDQVSCGTGGKQMNLIAMTIGGLVEIEGR